MKVVNLSKIRLVTFDVTGTLLKLRTAPGQQYGEVGAMYGVLADNNLLIKNFKEQFKRMNAEHPNFGLRTGLGWQNWWKNVVKETFKSSKMEYPEQKLDTIAESLLEMYKTTACWQHCYGCPGILSFLRSRGVMMGVISNYDPRLPVILMNTKLHHYFHFVLTSYELGIAKPDKKIFDKAIESSGLKSLSPENCLHIGNHPNYDYFGSKNAGWNSVLIYDDSLQKLREKYGNIDEKSIFSSLYQLHMHFLEHFADKLPTSKKNVQTT